VNPDPDTDPDTDTDRDTDSVPDPIRGFNDQKLKNNTADFFLSKNAIHLSLGLLEGRPSYRRSLWPSKKRSSNTSKDEIY
jgi:hypothetical protein